jgi:serine/threonine-protein kinase HipA
VNRCPITYRPCEKRYSEEGLKRLSPRLAALNDLPYTAQEQVRESAIRAAKMSIQGVQPKLSARLNLKSGVFEVVTIGGRYILKPQNPVYPELPENEDVTMRMAAAVDIETPLHGLIYAKDGSLTYFIERFDRMGRNKKLAMEDFSQLMGLPREAKYDGSMEKVASVIDRHCAFPALEKLKLFRLTVFCFLTGNEDMHLKNFSLISRPEKVELSPAYDLLNTSIAIGQPSEELALPLKGRKRKIDRSSLVDYFGKERLKLSDKVLTQTMGRFRAAFPEWERLIDAGFLSDGMKEGYQRLIRERWARVFG